jgi:hypothetical protein
MGSPVAVQTLFGTLSVGLRTNHTARGKHAHVGSGRNMPGTPCVNVTTRVHSNYATSCRTRTTKISGPPEATQIDGQRYFLPKLRRLAGPLHFAGYLAMPETMSRRLI